MTTLREMQGTIVGVFEDQADAQEAVRKLKMEGFTEAEIGIAAPAPQHSAVIGDASAKTAAAGAAVGLGAGALWGLGIVSGILPGIGPAIAGGTLAAILSSAAIGAGAVGLGGVFIGLGLPDEELEHYETEFKAGKTIVTVRAGDRTDVARAILERYRWVEDGAPPVDLARKPR